MPALVAIAIPLGILLMLNPLGLLGFGILGPIAGSYNHKKALQ
jgi:hypothetical protein